MKRVSFLFVSIFSLTTVVGQTSLPPSWNEIAANKEIQFDSRTEAYISPTRIVWQQTTGDATMDGLDVLLDDGNGQADLLREKVCHFNTGENGTISFVLDFGRELQGGLQIVTGRSGTKTSDVRLCFGESVSEAMSKIDGKNGATNDHAMRDFTMNLPWLGVAEVGNTGYRFVRVDILGKNADVKIKEIRARFAYRDIPYRGSFKSDNQRLNDIWMTGAYTVHLNMQEYLWDGIKRDRLVWIGDLHPEVMTVNTVFGYNEIVPKSLDLIRNSTPLPEWMNGISSYSIWWLLIQNDWYKYHGDKVYLGEQKEYLIALLKHLMTKIGDDGKEKLDGMRFLDWPSSPNNQGVHAGLQGLMVMAMDAGEELLLELDEPNLAKECMAASKKLKSYKPDHNDSKQGAALMALANIMDPKEANDEVLSVGGAKNFSTFYGYYMLQAMAKADNKQQAIDIISTYWGAMLDLGATTFWEDFDMDWVDNAAPIDELVPSDKIDVHGAYGNYCYKQLRHSLCHGWASGPTAWLTENVLGIKVLEPGCRTILIDPFLGDLKWVEGSFPTPLGDVKISHRRDSRGKIKTTVDAPEGIKVKVK